MKRKTVGFLVGAVLVGTALASWAQAPGGRPGDRYSERYNRPSGAPRYPVAPGAPGVPGPVAPPAAAAPAIEPALIPPGAIKFSAVPVHTNFYFVVDTNRVNLWTKISATSASNTVNAIVAKLPATVLVLTNWPAERPAGEAEPAGRRPPNENPRRPTPKLPQ